MTGHTHAIEAKVITAVRGQLWLGVPGGEVIRLWCPADLALAAGALVRIYRSPGGDALGWCEPLSGTAVALGGYDPFTRAAPLRVSCLGACRTAWLAPAGAQAISGDARCPKCAGELGEL